MKPTSVSEFASRAQRDVPVEALPAGESRERASAGVWGTQSPN